MNCYHVLERLADQPEPASLKEIQALSPLKVGRTKVCLSLLVGKGIVRQSGGTRYHLVVPGLSRDAIAAVGQAYRDKEEHDRLTLQRMVDYAEGKGCYWQALLSYFNDDALLAGPCHHCGNDPTIPDEEARLAKIRQTVEARLRVQIKRLSEKSRLYPRVRCATLG